jgi:hypothetical protein
MQSLIKIAIGLVALSTFTGCQSCLDHFSKFEAWKMHTFCGTSHAGCGTGLLSHCHTPSYAAPVYATPVAVAQPCPQPIYAAAPCAQPTAPCAQPCNPCPTICPPIECCPTEVCCPTNCCVSNCGGVVDGCGACDGGCNNCNSGTPTIITQGAPTTTSTNGQTFAPTQSYGNPPAPGAFGSGR